VNMGFIVISLSLGTYAGLYAAVYYFLVYLFTMVQLFSVLLVLRRKHDLAKINVLTMFSDVSDGSF
jgi:NADH:ubiquinone oxidoreductase subunit 2 (subunit N)